MMKSSPQKLNCSTQMKAQKGELLAKKKNVADLAQDALNSAALFADDLTTAEKNSDGERLPDDFFAEEQASKQTVIEAAAETAKEELSASHEDLPENEVILPEEPANEDDYTLVPGTIEADIDEGLELGAD